jgi:lipopolysaccharide transport system permease protein
MQRADRALAASAHYRITPDPPSIAEQIREILGAGDLFRMLFARELRVRYKQTALGVVWVVLQPLVPALIFALVFGAFARLPSAGTPYFLFALSGLVIFGLFANAASRAGTAFIRDGQLVSKVYFPRALLPLASGSATIVDFAVGVIAILVLMLATGHLPSIALIAVPVIALAALALGLAFGLAISALSAHYRDFAIAVPFALQVLLYASPVVYSAELVPAELRPMYGLNPMVAVTEGFRSAILGISAPSAAEVAMATAIGALTVVIGVVVFSRATRDLTDIL